MNQPLFLNSQEMLVDAKLRVGIPERFMKVLKQICPDHVDQIGLAATPDRSIKLMPYPYFMAALEQWNALDDRISDQRVVLNLSAGFADLLKLDKQNRIRLNPEMCKFCNITREVIIVGTLKYMQIFDRGVWNTLVRKGMSKFGGAADAVAAKAAEPAPVQLIVQARTGPETG